MSKRLLGAALVALLCSCNGCFVTPCDWATAVRMCAALGSEVHYVMANDSEEMTVRCRNEKGARFEPSGPNACKEAGP